MSMKHALITGGSKGIGNGLALKFKAEGYKIWSFARSSNENLAEENQITCDLTNLKEAEDTFSQTLAKVLAESPQEIVLINNAGTLGTVDRLENNSVDSIDTAIRLNLTVPMALTATFIKKLEGADLKKEIINISSGAAASPYYGWSTYCSSKAAVDMFTQVVAKEQETASYPVRILSIYPGIVDTNMQTEIRSRNKEQFELIEKFIESKEQDLLSSPAEAANAVYELLADSSLKSGEITDVRV